jgi:hypothetical protein
MIDLHRTKELFRALLFHLTNARYNALRYNFKAKNSDYYEHEYWFDSICLKLQTEDKIKQFFLANFMDSFSKCGQVARHPTDFEDGMGTFARYSGDLNRLSYIFKADLKALDRSVKELIEVKDGQTPILLQQFIGQKIHLFTITIILDLLPKTKKYWEKNCDDTYLIPDYCMVLDKFRMLFEYDKEKFRTILKEHNESYQQVQNVETQR